MDLFPAIVATIIAGIVAYIGYLQWRTNNDKLRLDLFDRRFAVYKGLKEFFLAVLREVRISEKELFKLIEFQEESFFLFNKEIYNYCEIVYNKGARLNYLNTKLDLDKFNDENAREAAVKELYDDLLVWFQYEFRELNIKFESYLRFKNINKSIFK